MFKRNPQYRCGGNGTCHPTLLAESASILIPNHTVEYSIPKLPIPSIFAVITRYANTQYLNTQNGYGPKTQIMRYWDRVRIPCTHPEVVDQVLGWKHHPVWETPQLSHMKMAKIGHCVQSYMVIYCVQLYTIPILYYSYVIFLYAMKRSTKNPG